MWLWIRHILEILVFSFLFILFVSWEYWLTTGIAYLFGFYVIFLILDLIERIYVVIILLINRNKK